MLTKATILDLDDLVRETVPVPEWGVDVVVRTMTGGERDAFESEISKAGGFVGMDNVRARLIVRTAVDESGARLFTDDDVVALSGKSAAALSRLFDVAARLNGLTKEDKEELAGNSSGVPGADSASD